MRNTLIFLLLLGFVHPSAAQQTLFDPDYTLADERALRVEGNQADSIVRQLIKNDTAEMFKVRAIFRWIAEHVRYDIEGKGDEFLYSDLTQEEFPVSEALTHRAAYEERIVQYVLKERKAICYGYALLFKKMCALAGIKSYVVNGYGKTTSNPIGKPFESNHSWNLVEISGKSYLLDLTWASGTVDDDGVYEKKFLEHYFMTPPVEFILDHYPEQPRWSLLKSPPDKATFFLFPYVMKESRAPAFGGLLPTKGLITCRPWETVTIQFKTKEPVRSVEIQAVSEANEIVADNLDEKATPAKLVFEYKDNQVSASVLIPKQNTVWLDVLVNEERILRYAVKMTY